MDKIQEDRLYIDSLKETFGSYNSISIDDFSGFYKEILGDISRSTVKWYIYELKKEKVIRNVARGLYAFEDENRNAADDHAVITMDIIKSTGMDYQVFNEELEKKVRSLNKEIEKVLDLDRLYHISQGDEIQMFCPLDDRLGRLLLLTLCKLRPFLVRYAVSIGSFDGEIKRNSWEMNAPIFWNARDGLKDLKGGKGYEGWCVSEYAQADHLCNNVLPLVNKEMGRITDKQWEVVRLELLQVDWVDAMEELGISKTSYYSRLNASNLDEILKVFRTISDLMQKRSVLG